MKITQATYSYFCGWNEKLAKQNFKIFGDRFPRFELDGPMIHDEKEVFMWEFLRKVNGGQDLENVNQLIGDCTSWGTKKPCDHLQAYEIIRRGENEVFTPVSHMYNYGVSRVLIGGQQGDYSDGSTGEWCAKGVEKYGVVPITMQPTYDGRTTKEWGAKGPPKTLQDVGVKHLVKTAALVTTVEQVKTALLNGYPINVCSNRGFQMQGRIKNGKLFGIPSGSWNHSMSWIGIAEDGVYNLNSWGPDTHGKCPTGAPLGGFWVDWDTVAYMVRQNDSYAYSQFDGFPAQDIPKEKFKIFGRR